MKPKFIGITGTNGKTTTTWLVRSILQIAGLRCAVIGTLSGQLTTPSPWHLRRLIRRYTALKYDWIVMEVSSHGIHQHRIKGIPYTVKALTNITQDHLDYHKTMEAYRQIKLDWFFSGSCVRATTWPEAILEAPIRNIPLSLPSGWDMKNSFQEKNKQLAADIARGIGISDVVIAKGLEMAPPVPGRFEWIPTGQPFSVIIDFAHTPDGLENILQEARHHLQHYALLSGTSGRLILMFGCGGDRDKSKRPLMGAIAVRFADVVMMTSDNPRSESPAKIMEDIMQGISATASHQVEIYAQEDRRKAIHQVLELAQAGDLIVLAGKGHETTQIFKDHFVHFNDKEEVLAYYGLLY